ncbi:MAG: hypothetical protein GF331_06950, partial [Chitinivibrionales bacterium]|nr:hypothetical protein [Chitinivibrionales bacterium]
MSWFTPLRHGRAALHALGYLLTEGNAVGYIGWTGFGNLGDEALYAAVRRLLGPDRVLPYRTAGHVARMERRLHARFYRAVCLGGGTLVNTVPFLQRTDHALTRNLPCFCLGTGVQDPALDEPHPPSLVQQWVDHLDRFVYRGVRGPLSQRLLAEAGCRDVEVIGDPAILLGPKTFMPKTGNRTIGLNVGISPVRMWCDPQAVLRFAHGLCSSLRARGWRVVLFMVWPRDSALVGELARMLGGEATVISCYNSYRRFMRQAARCDVFVGQKLHSTILAMSAGTPSVMLAYQSKCLDFMASMGCEEFTMRLDQLDIDRALHLVDSLADNSADHQRHIAAQLERYRALQRGAVQRVRQMLA